MIDISDLEIGLTGLVQVGLAKAMPWRKGRKIPVVVLL